MRASKIKVNPARLVRGTKEPLGRVRFPSYEEEAKLRKAIAATLPGRIKDEGESAFAQLDVAHHTGMRKSEQFTATWGQVDLERGYIYLSMTKNGSDRFVTLNSAVVEVLKRLKERHKELGLPSDSTLFHSKWDPVIKNPRKRFATALEQAGIKGVTWHTLRHTFASRPGDGWGRLKDGTGTDGTQDDRHDRSVCAPCPDAQTADTGDLGASGFGFGADWPQTGY
jgi:integrase